MPLYDIDSSKSKVDLRNVSHEQLVELLEGLGYPKFRAKQVEDWVWKHHVTDFQDMTNVPAKLRADLAERCTLGGTVEVARQISNDGSRKYLLQAMMTAPKPSALACPTATASPSASPPRQAAAWAALWRHGPGRLLPLPQGNRDDDQVMHVSEDFQTRASSVVMMGQGEPFNNYDEVLKALRMLNSPEGACIGARHLTGLTCGIIPMIRRFAKEPEQFTLAVSLHSAVQSTRNTIMPGVKKYNLQAA